MKMMATDGHTAVELVCDLHAISKGDRVRHAKLSHDLVALMGNVRRVRGGYAFDLPGIPQVLRKIARWIPLERACCPFLEFNVAANAGSGPFTLALTGPPGTEAFLREELGMDDADHDAEPGETDDVHAAGDTRAEESDSVRVVLASFKAVEDRDEALVRKVFHPEFESHWPMSLPYGGVKRGFNASGTTWTNTWNRLQPTDAQRAMSPRVVAAHGDEVVVHWQQRGMDGTGAVYDGEVLGIYEVRDGKLARAQMFYFDTSAVADFLARAESNG